MKKFAVALLLLVLAAPAVFAGSWRNVVIEHAQADYRNNVTISDSGVRRIKHRFITII